VRKEADVSGKGPQSHVLKEFLMSKQEKLKKIKLDCKNAQVCGRIAPAY
jgi:formic-like protein